MAPVRTPDGHITVPEEVIHSMQKNKIGLKGFYPVSVCVCGVCSEHFHRTFGDTSGKRCCLSEPDPAKVAIA